MNSDASFEWAPTLLFGLTFAGIASGYYVFVRRARRAGVDEDHAFRDFMQHITPYCVAAVALTMVVLFMWEVLQGGFGGSTILMLIVFGPSAAVIGGLVGSVTWRAERATGPRVPPD